MILAGENNILREKPVSEPLLFTTNPLWTGLGLNLDFHDERSDRVPDKDTVH
jgi:hypothetical protein